MLENLLSGDCTIHQAVERTELLVLSDPGTLFAKLTGVYFSAVDFFADEDFLITLVDYLVALASLPDAVTPSPEAMVMELGGYNSYTIEVGEIIDLGDGKLWSALPGFSMNVTERFQGPEAYVNDQRSPDSLKLAERRWRHMNAWLIVVATSAAAQTIPVLSRLKHLSVKTLALALEYSPTTPLGRNVDLHVPSAALWLEKAGEIIEVICAAEVQRFPAGDLWEKMCSQDAEVCNEARLRFWRARLVELGYQERKARTDDRNKSD